MAKYKHYNYSQNVLIPASLAEQIAPGTLEFAIHVLVEERMDMSRFDDKFKNDGTGCKAYNPKILLKIILLAYSRGILHSRKIERECKRNVTFMALSCWQDHYHLEPAGGGNSVLKTLAMMKQQMNMNVLWGRGLSLKQTRPKQTAFFIGVIMQMPKIAWYVRKDRGALARKVKEVNGSS